MNKYKLHRISRLFRPRDANSDRQGRYNDAMELTLNDLEQAINHWRRLRPSTGDEHALSAEVNTLATVYALMIFEQMRSCPLDAIDPAARTLIDAWRQASGLSGSVSP